MEKVDWSKAPEWANAVVVGEDNDMQYWVEDWGILSKRQKLTETFIDKYVADMTGDHSWRLVERRSPTLFKMEYEGHEVEILATSDKPYAQAAIRFPDGQLAVVCKGWLKPIKTEREKWIDEALVVTGVNSGWVPTLGLIYDKMIDKK